MNLEQAWNHYRAAQLRAAGYGRETCLKCKGMGRCQTCGSTRIRCFECDGSGQSWSPPPASMPEVLDEIRELKPVMEKLQDVARKSPWARFNKDGSLEGIYDYIDGAWVKRDVSKVSKEVAIALGLPPWGRV